MAKRYRTTTARRGAAAVELAFVLPPLITLLLGCVDFGRFPHSYMAVINAARAGAGYGATHPYTTATASAWQAAVRQAVLDEMQNVAGFDATKLSVTTTLGIDSGGATNVTVDVRYPFQTLIAWPVLPASLTLRQVTVMRSVR